MAEDQTAVEERPELSVTVEDSGPARKLLTIEVPESRIKDKIEESYGTLSDDAQLPGFRKGRAPRRLLERRFGSSVRDDVKGQLLSECFSQAIEDEKLEVLGEPDVHFLFNSDYEHAPERGLVVESAHGDFTLPQINTYALALGYDAPVLETLYHQLKLLES